MIETQKGHIE